MSGGDRRSSVARLISASISSSVRVSLMSGTSRRSRLLLLALGQRLPDRYLDRLPLDVGPWHGLVQVSQLASGPLWQAPPMLEAHDRAREDPRAAVGNRARLGHRCASRVPASVRT